MTSRLTRREFIQTSAAITASAALAGRLEARSRAVAAPTGPRAKVVLIRDPKVLTETGAVDKEIMGRMLDQAICALFGTKTAEEAWKQLFKPTDKAGIKTNEYPYLRTPVEVEALLKTRIATVGIPEAQIPVADHKALQMLSDRTALVNVRPVRTHHWSGIGGCIKNMILFSPTPDAYHPDSCSSLGALWHLPVVKGKTRLNILLVLRPLFYGRGPHNFDPRFQWNYGGLFMSTDPVALDALGAELLRLKRIDHFGEDRPVTPTKHVQKAETEYKLGVSDLRRIDLVKLGSKEDILLA